MRPKTLSGSVFSVRTTPVRCDVRGDRIEVVMSRVFPGPMCAKNMTHGKESSCGSPSKMRSRCHIAH